MPVLANLCKTYLYYTLYVIYIQYVNKGHIMPTLIIQCVILCKNIYLFVHYINIFKSWQLPMTWLALNIQHIITHVRSAYM